jgi:hypothetical protein
VAGPAIDEEALRKGLRDGEPEAAVRLGDLLSAQSRLEEAEKAFQEGLARGDPDAAVRLGQLAELQNRPREAESSYRVGLERGDGEAGTKLGDLLARLGRVDEAVDAYRIGVERGDPEAGARLDALAETAGSASAADPDGEASGTVEAAAPASAAGEEFDFLATAAADLPSEKDLLGFGALVDALYSLLDDRRTVLPLALAITAPWGAGKSSVMRQLQGRLNSPPASPAPNRRWATVRFDAWKYENSERLWAALAKAIYEQPQARMPAWRRVAFRVRLERRRLGWPRFLLKYAWPALLAAGAVLALLAADVGGAGAGAAGVAAAAAAFAAAARYWGAITDPFKAAMERYASRPDYESHLGFTAEADRDIRALTGLLCPDDQHVLAVFVDDLDRCSSAHVVEVVEAMNQIFNSDERHGCVFVLGLDREVVASNIDVAYKDTIAQLRLAGSRVAEDFGLQFLGKLVQMSVAIPPPEPDRLVTLLAEITGSAAPTSLHAAAAPASDERVQQAEEAIARHAHENLASLGAEEPHEVGVDAGTLAAAVRRQRAKRLRDSSEVVAAEFHGLRYLDPNPRQVKRFHNAFRLQLYVANADERLPFDFSGNQLVALSRWVAIRLRWPGLAQDIDQEAQLLHLLELDANGGPLDAIGVTNDEAVRLRTSYARWFTDPRLRDVLTEPEPHRRVAELPFEQFLHVA